MFAGVPICCLDSLVLGPVKDLIVVSTGVLILHMWTQALDNIAPSKVNHANVSTTDECLAYLV